MVCHLAGPNHPNWKGGRKIQEGYVMVLRHGHPRASKGYVREHIIVAETAIGHALPKGAIVHHSNEDTTDNRNKNLVVLQSRGDHKALHMRLRTLKLGGDPWKQRICCTCHRVLDLDQFHARPRVCRSCRHLADKLRWAEHLKEVGRAPSRRRGSATGTEG